MAANTTSTRSKGAVTPNVGAFVAAGAAALGAAVAVVVMELGSRPSVLAVVAGVIVAALLALGIAAVAGRRGEPQEDTELTSETDEPYRVLFDESPLAMWVFDAETLEFLEVNRAAVERYGYTREEFLTMKVSEIRPKEDVPALVGSLAHPERPAFHRWRHLTKDGRLLNVEVYGHALDFHGRRARLVLVVDITENLRAELAVRESEQRLRTLFDRNLAGVFRAHMDGRMIECNATFRRMIGLSSTADISSMNMGDFYVDSNEAVANFAELRRVATIMNQEAHLRRSDGGSVWVLGNVSIVPGGAGDRSTIEGTVVDVTRRRQAETSEAKARSEQRTILLRLARVALVFGSARKADDVYRELADFLATSVPASSIVVTRSEEGRQAVVYARRAGVEVDASELDDRTPPTPGEIAISTGETVISSVDLADPRPGSLAVPMMAMGETVGAVEVHSSVAHTYTREQATVVQLATNLAAIAVENVELLDRERLQVEQSRQAQKMEAVGRLAGGVAHDFNNLLTVINGYTSLTLVQLREDDPLREDVEEIQRAGERAATLTRQLLAFSRHQILAPKAVDLNALVGDMQRMLSRMIGEDVVLRTDLAERLSCVLVDPGQLEQVIANLAVNARDAMPEGGSLTVATADATLDEEYAATHPGSRAGEFVRLTVTDTGCGMDDAIKQRIFEPFYTTKETGRGTGLGLSTVYGIVKQSEGYVEVQSELGRGSTFAVYLPRVAAPAEAPVVRVAKPERGGTERVLIVEDESAVRMIAKTVLERAGFNVVAVGDGVEAVTLCETTHYQPDLLITDVVMPGMTGREVAERVCDARPRIKVLFMSGYAEDELVRRSLSAREHAFLAKPFTSDDLLRAVRAALEAESPAPAQPAASPPPAADRGR